MGRNPAWRVGTLGKFAVILALVTGSAVFVMPAPASAAVYGNPSTLPVNETAELRPISPYGFHKIACELLAREAAQCFDQDVLICRFFSVFGRKQHRLLVWELYQQLVGSDDAISLDGTWRFKLEQAPKPPRFLS